MANLVIWPANSSFMSLPCAQDTGGERLCIDTQDGLKASDCGRLGRQAAGHPWSALRVVKSLPKRLPNGLGAAEAKAAALHPKRYQSSLSKLSTQEVGEAGKRKASNRIDYQA